MDSEVILKCEKCDHSIHQWDLRDASAYKNIEQKDIETLENISIKKKIL